MSACPGFVTTPPAPRNLLFGGVLCDATQASEQEESASLSSVILDTFSMFAVDIHNSGSIRSIANSASGSVSDLYCDNRCGDRKGMKWGLVPHYQSPSCLTRQGTDAVGGFERNRLISTVDAQSIMESRRESRDNAVSIASRSF